jgi:hypothetical protein
MTITTITMTMIIAGAILIAIGLVIMLLSLSQRFKRYVSEVASRFTNRPGQALAGIGVTLIIVAAILNRFAS